MAVEKPDAGVPGVCPGHVDPYGTDNTSRVLAGDVDGDSRADLLLSNGTARWRPRGDS